MSSERPSALLSPNEAGPASVDVGPASCGRDQRPRAAKVVGSVLVGVVVAMAVVLVGFNAFIYLQSPVFFHRATPGIDIPGTHDGFVVQDIDYLESASAWLFSGYDGGGGPSPVYRRDSDGTVSRVLVETPDGKQYAGHGSGITHSGDKVLLTYEDGYLVLEARALAGAKDGDVVSAVSAVSVGFAPAFLNAQDGMLYTGVFYNGTTYTTPPEMEVYAPDGTVNHAVMYAFARDDNAASGFRDVPQAVYSIPDKVQGVCVTAQGSFVFSTSYGFSPSHMLAHRATLPSIGTYDVAGEAVPLFCFDEATLKSDMAMPPMSEGIVMINGRIYVPFESACNKYLFGKLYGSGRIYSFDASATKGAGDIIRDSLSVSNTANSAA